MTSLAKKFSRAARPSRMETVEQDEPEVPEVKNKSEEDEGIGSDDSPTASSTTSGDSDRESKVETPSPAMPAKSNPKPRSISTIVQPASAPRNAGAMGPKHSVSGGRVSVMGTDHKHLARFLRSIGIKPGMTGPGGSGAASGRSSLDETGSICGSPGSSPGGLLAGPVQRGRVFGKDLTDHLKETDNEIPTVVRCCAEYIERFGMVDGIYRLSGIASNIRALKLAFESSSEESSATVLDSLSSDPARARQDVHSVSSLLKLYCRELPDPLCTFALYSRFLRAASLADEFRLAALREVLAQLPREHFRTLAYLMRHLCLVSSRGGATGMNAKNLAIVWAPNLLRSLEESLSGLVAAAAASSTGSPVDARGHLVDVAAQAVCTEALIKHCDILFSEDLPLFSSLGTFELGIEDQDKETKEVDIDSAIRKAENNNTTNNNILERPRSIAIPNTEENEIKTKIDAKTFLTPGAETKSVTTVNLERSRSSVSSLFFGSNNNNNNTKRPPQLQRTSSPSTLLQLQQFKTFLAQRLNLTSEVEDQGQLKEAEEEAKVNVRPKRRLLKSVSALPVTAETTEEEIAKATQEGENDKAEDSNRRRDWHLRRRHLRQLRQTKSSECLRKRHSSTAIPTASKPPLIVQSSSEGSSSNDNDKAAEVLDELQLSFDLDEDKEMRMMNCSLDDNDYSPDDLASSATSGKSPARRRLFVDEMSFGGLKQKMRQRFSSPSPMSRNKRREEEEPGQRKTSGMLRVLMNPITRRASSANSANATDNNIPRNRNVYRVEENTNKVRKKGRKELSLSPPLAVSSSSSSVDIRVVRERVRKEMQQPMSLQQQQQQQQGRRISQQPDSEDNGEEEEEEDAENEISLVQELNVAWEQKRSEMDKVDSDRDSRGETRKHSQESTSSSSSMSSSLPPYTFGLTSAALLLQSHHFHQQDSGFESSSEVVTHNNNNNSCGNYENLSSLGEYENLKVEQRKAKVRAFEAGPKELSTKVPEEDTHDYQNIDVVVRKDPLSSSKRASIPSSSNYQSKQIKKRATTTSSLYQNVDFAQANRSLLMLSEDANKNRRQSQTGRKISTGCQKQQHPTSRPHVNNSNGRQKVYENCEFVGNNNSSVYQNVTRKSGRSKSVGSHVAVTKFAEKQQRKTSEVVGKNDDEVYAQVKFLRKQVQEVNAMLEDANFPNKNNVDLPPSKRRTSQSHSRAVQHRARSSGSVIPVVPRPSSSVNNNVNKKTYLPNLSKTVEATERKMNEIESDESLKKNTCLTSSERRRAHFRALLSRFDNNNPESSSSSNNLRKGSLPVAVQSSRVRSTSLVQDRKQRLSVDNNHGRN